jgi:hypothetical protein
MSPVIYVFDFDATLRPMYCFFAARRAAQERVKETVRSMLGRDDVYVGINTARPFFLPMRKRYLHKVFGFSISDLPDGAVQYSGTSAASKTENMRRIHAAYEKHLGVAIPTSSVWLFDDQKANVAAANAAGFRGVLVDRVSGCQHLSGRHIKNT